MTWSTRTPYARRMSGSAEEAKILIAEHQLSQEGVSTLEFYNKTIISLSMNHKRPRVACGWVYGMTCWSDSRGVEYLGKKSARLPLADE